MQWSEDEVDRLYEAIGDRIRSVRGRGRATQTDLARQVGLTRSSIANIEAGRQRAMIHTLFQLADALGVSLAELVPEPGSTRGSDIALTSDALEGHPSTTHDFVTAALRHASEE